MITTVIICAVCISLGCIIGFVFACICTSASRSDEIDRAFDAGYVKGRKDEAKARS